MNLNEFSYEENGRRYINPQVALDEENAFIQKLRDNQAQDNAKIYRDTHNLGTDVPSNIGGLNGGETYFNARYQTPQTNYNVANLRAAAQAQALSQVMNNELEKAKKRYQDAYRAANSGGGSGGTSGNLDNSVTGDVDVSSGGDTYELKHKGTEGAPDPGTTGGLKKREYHFLGSNGQRVPITVVGSGPNLIVESPVKSYSGKESVTNYVGDMLRNGYKLLQNDSNGRAVDIGTNYHTLWGI